MTAAIAKTAPFFILICCMMLWISAPVRADYYTYKDSGGTVHITNSLDSVPVKFRSTMKVRTDDSLAKKDVGARTSPPQQPGGEPAAAQEQRGQPSAPPAPPDGRFGELATRFPWLKPLIVVAGFFAALLVVVKLSSLLSSPHMARLVYLSFFLAVFVFGYKLYADHLVNSYFSVKQKVLSMFKKSTVREGMPNVAGAEKQ